MDRTSIDRREGLFFLSMYMNGSLVQAPRAEFFLVSAWFWPKTLVPWISLHTQHDICFSVVWLAPSVDLAFRYKALESTALGVEKCDCQQQEKRAFAQRQLGESPLVLNLRGSTRK